MDAVTAQFNQLFFTDQIEEASHVLHSAKLDPHVLTPEMAKIQEDTEFIHRARELLQCPEWTPVRSDDGITVTCKGSSTDFFCKVNTVIDSPLFPVLSVIGEIDLLPQWASHVGNPAVLIQPSHLRRLVRYTILFPWPLSDRECFMEAISVPVKEEKAALIILRTPTSDTYLGADIPGVHLNTPRVDIKIVILYVQYVNENRTNFTLIVRANPNLTAMHSMIATMRHQILNFAGSEHERMVKKKAEFYNYIRELIEMGIHQSSQLATQQKRAEITLRQRRNVPQLNLESNPNFIQRVTHQDRLQSLCKRNTRRFALEVDCPGDVASAIVTNVALPFSELRKHTEFLFLALPAAGNRNFLRDSALISCHLRVTSTLNMERKEQPASNELIKTCWAIRSITKERAILKQKSSCAKNEQAHQVYSVLMQRAETQSLSETQRLKELNECASPWAPYLFYTD